jgi:hypothetical protein
MISFAVPRYITSNHEWKVQSKWRLTRSLAEERRALIARPWRIIFALIAFLKMQMPLLITGGGVNLSRLSTNV